MKKILAIGAHFDDIELGCGGTIFKHIENGDYVYFAITSSDEFRTGAPNIRLKEQYKAMKQLGIKKDNLFLYSDNDNISDIIGPLDNLKSDIIFSPFENDTHQAHRRASIIAQAIGRKRPTTTVFYDSGSTYDFYPNVFSEIYFDIKMGVLQSFTSQILHGAINLDIVSRKNSYWASLVSQDINSYAEGFVVRKMIYTF